MQYLVDLLREFDRVHIVLDGIDDVRVFEEEGDCIICLEMRADELMRRLISGELTNYRVVRTSLEPLQMNWPIMLKRTSSPLLTICFEMYYQWSRYS